MDFLLFTSENEDSKIRMTTSMDVAFVLSGLFHEQQKCHANKLLFDRIRKYRQQTKTKLSCAAVYVHSFTSKIQDSKMMVTGTHRTCVVLKSEAIHGCIRQQNVSGRWKALSSSFHSGLFMSVRKKNAMTVPTE